MAKLDKLNIKKQLKHMENKGLKFNTINHTDAETTLTTKNYYFRLKSYARNFPKVKNSNGKYDYKLTDNSYKDLEFIHLEKFASLDFYFRNLILKMVYSIEHFAKVQLSSDYTDICTDIEGNEIVKRYLSTNSTLKIKLNSKLKEHANGYQKNLINKFTDINSPDVEDFPIWALIEILSFGEFIQFYNYFYNIENINRVNQKISNALWSVKILRNAVSHNMCLLNSIKHSYKINKFNPNKDILNIYTSLIKDTNEKKQFNYLFTNNLVFHDFCVSLCVFSTISSENVLNYFYKDDVSLFIVNLSKRIELYKDNQEITIFLSLINKTIDTQHVDNIK